MIKHDRNALSFGMLFAIILISGQTSTAIAQERFDDPDDTLKSQFWGQVYASGGSTFFCNQAFAKKTVMITDSYIFPLNHVRDTLHCGSQRACLKDSADYRHIASDLHNIVPALMQVEMHRRGAKFDQLDSRVAADECGMRASFMAIEPPDRIKGNIARTLAYMIKSYNLPFLTSVEVLKSWNQLDPVDPEELERNKKIEVLQGNINPYVSDPGLMDQL